MSESEIIAEYADRDEPRLYHSQLRALTELTPNDFLILQLFLEGNEDRIAHELDGLGMLAGLFAAIVGRPPQCNP